MSNIKKGDKIRILAVDDSTFQLYPELVNMEVIISGFDKVGDPQFVYGKPVPLGFPYGRRHALFLNICEEDGWKFGVVE